jgi:TonB family protein
LAGDVMKRLVVALALFPIVVWAQATPSDTRLIPPTTIRPKVSGPACTYPQAALRPGVTEQTILTFHVTADGKIVDVGVYASTENAVLDEAAVRCLSNWHADPSEVAGFGSLRAHIYWTSPPGNYANLPVGTFTIGRVQTCEGFYPPDEAKQKIGGTTTVKFHVSTAGGVSDPQVAESSGDTGLDQAALSCVQSWHYQPAMQNGQPVDFEKKVAVKWTPR